LVHGISENCIADSLAGVEVGVLYVGPFWRTFALEGVLRQQLFTVLVSTVGKLKLKNFVMFG